MIGKNVNQSRAVADCLLLKMRCAISSRDVVAMGNCKSRCSKQAFNCSGVRDSTKRAKLSQQRVLRC
jgi:hypothetical protein